MTPTWPLRTIAFGGDYNPEQWDRSVWREDVALMQRAGVTLVTVGVFSWARLEPEPGRFELDWLREVLDLLHEGGIAVDLATPTASPPPWLGALHPETLPVTADGVRLTWGSRSSAPPRPSTATAPWRSRAPWPGRSPTTPPSWCDTWATSWARSTTPTSPRTPSVAGSPSVTAASRR